MLLAATLMLVAGSGSLHAQQWLPDWLGGAWLGPSQGALVARPGMPVAEMLRLSTLKLNVGKTVIADGAVFTFQVAGTGISLPGCRYYFITFARGDDTRVGMMSIGTAHQAMPWDAVEAADTSLRQLLAADGWLAGHEVYRDEQDRRLHGGRTEGPEGDMWLNGDTVLHIQRRRIDDPERNEPPHAGRWIQFVNLSERPTWPWIERYMFAPPKP